MKTILPTCLVMLICSSGWSQTVQLPTYRVYSGNSSVTVPDGGAAYLGGNTVVRSDSRGASIPVLGRLPIAGRPFQNRGIGQDVTTTNSWVTARIIDHREWDAAVLAEARAKSQATTMANIEQARTEEAARFLTAHMGRSPVIDGTVNASSGRLLGANQQSPRSNDAPLRLGSRPKGTERRLTN